VISTIMFLHCHVVSFPEISNVVACFLFVAGSFALSIDIPFSVYNSRLE